jgi:hypothetical protein
MPCDAIVSEHSLTAIGNSGIERMECALAAANRGHTELVR